jgi:hypothetical protein
MVGSRGRWSRLEARARRARHVAVDLMQNSPGTTAARPAPVLQQAISVRNLVLRPRRRIARSRQRHLQRKRESSLPAEVVRRCGATCPCPLCNNEATVRCEYKTKSDKRARKQNSVKHSPRENSSATSQKNELVTPSPTPSSKTPLKINCGH